MTRVLHVMTGLNGGGAETALLRLLANEDRSRFTSSVFSLTGDGPIGGELGRIGFPRLNGDARKSSIVRSMAELVRYCRRNRPDIIQGWMYHGNLAASLAARVAGVPRHGWNVRSSLHDLDQRKALTRLVVFAGARLSSRPNWIIYNSRRSAAQHQGAGYDRARAVLIPNGFDSDILKPNARYRAELRARHGLDPSQPVVGIIARYHREKDHAMFIRAANELKARLPDVHFVCIGRGVTWQTESLRIQIEQCGLRNRFHLLGELPDAGRCATMFDVNVLASTAEAFPNVVAEGMACGVPTVATDVGDTAWVIGDTGRIVPPGQPRALALAVSELLTMNSAERLSLGGAARARIVEHFSMRNNVAAYCRLFEQR